jgi:quercetin dioxygenase-like cupin family protein
MRTLAFLAVLAVLFGGSQKGFAQRNAEPTEQPQAPPAALQLKRTVVVKSDLQGVPDKQMLAWVAEVAPGGNSGWHYHPYDEFVYVLDGAVTMQIKGEAPVTVHAGETFHAPANTVHRATNASDNPAKGLVFGLTAKDEPLAVPVKQ